ncbi:DsbA family oxidoreductase [Paraburkholderia oxyphila]|uniref:DsbA family oxidoreductase n=1 Tax=Paraburkholderia oxyphila TaxID=614212 RepID=UPI0004805547|nr:DsbA family oxidoreductase [Paraburkholderia oxyphila]
MKRLLRIDFVSDVACPWCAIALSSLELALSHFDDTVDVELVMHPFELNPHMVDDGEPVIEYFERKYGRTAEQVAQVQAELRERGAKVGFTFGQRSRVHNTFDAHRLLHWAGIKGKQVALKRALLQAYHGEDKAPGNRDVLVEAAESVGLNGADARAVLQCNEYALEVRKKEEKYQAMGINSVPSIIFDDRYLVTGARPVESFEQAIKEILAER